MFSRTRTFVLSFLLKRHTYVVFTEKKGRMFSCARTPSQHVNVQTGTFSIGDERLFMIFDAENSDSEVETRISRWPHYSSRSGRKPRAGRIFCFVFTRNLHVPEWTLHVFRLFAYTKPKLDNIVKTYRLYAGKMRGSLGDPAAHSAILLARPVVLFCRPLCSVAWSSATYEIKCYAGKMYADDFFLMNKLTSSMQTKV